MEGNENIIICEKCGKIKLLQSDNVEELHIDLNAKTLFEKTSRFDPPYLVSMYGIYNNDWFNSIYKQIYKLKQNYHSSTQQLIENELHTIFMTLQAQKLVDFVLKKRPFLLSNTLDALRTLYITIQQEGIPKFTKEFIRKFSNFENKKINLLIKNYLGFES